MGEKCNCGRFFMNPVPLFCSRCKKSLKSGSPEGEKFRVTYKDKSILTDGNITLQFFKSWDDMNNHDTGNLMRNK
jgi:hypothetical protein